VLKASKKRVFLIYIFALFFIYFNYTSYPQFVNKITKEQVMIVPFGATVGIALSLLFPFQKINKKSFILSFIMLANVLISAIVNNSFYSENNMLITAIFIAFIVSNVVTKEEFINCYINLIVFFAVYSLITTYVFMPWQLNGVLKVFPTYGNDIKSYIDTYFSMALFTHGIGRNCGFAREPGVYQIFLTIGIFLSIEYKEATYKNLFKTIILMITLLTTFSAVGYVSLVISIIMLFKKFSKASNRLLGIIIIFSVLITVFVILVNTNPYIAEELERTSDKWGDSTQGSFAVRLSGVTSNATLFTEKPLFGYGLVSSWLEIIDRFGYVDVTGTTFIGFAAFGIVFGCIIHYLLWHACRCRSMFNTVVWFLTILFVTLSQNLIISHLLWIFLFLPFMKSSEEVEKEKLIRDSVMLHNC